jgi:hypothetical protein
MSWLSAQRGRPGFDDLGWLATVDVAGASRRKDPVTSSVSGLVKCRERVFDLQE